MKKGLFNRRIPTLLALIGLLLVIGISTVLVQSGIIYIGKAAPDTKPQNLLITNITDTSFTATFTTAKESDAVLSLSDADIGKTLTLDDRDKSSGSSRKYFSHHITVFNLSPKTKYFFKFIVSGAQYQSSEYSVTTGDIISGEPPQQNPLFGMVLLPGGAPGVDTLITAKTENSQLVSAITDSKGEFILPTNSLRESNFAEYQILKSDSVFTINAIRETMSAMIISTFSNAQNLPAITLQQKYSFLESAVEEATGSSAFNFVAPPVGSTIDIKTPKQGESFIDQSPQFSGTAYPGKSITISIPGLGDQQVIANTVGSWTYKPTVRIPQGDHRITIATTDSENKTVTISRRFSIFPLGSQVTQSATPSATIVPTRTPTPTVKPTATPTPTIIVTATIAPTSITPTIAVTSSPIPTISPTTVSSPTPTLIATQTPTVAPTAYTTPTNRPTINPPGAAENTAILTGFSLFLIIAGVALLFAL